MKRTVTKQFSSILEPCKYKLDITFSCFDVLTGEELKNFDILIDGEPVTEFTITEQEADGRIRYLYEILDVGPKTFTLTIDKNRYFPFEKQFSLTAKSIHDDPVPEDLGRIPLLSEIKTNAIVLTWGQYPSDLDAKLINPDGSITAVTEQGGQMRTYYSIVDIDDKASYGPETISFSRWSDWDTKYKVAGTFNYRVNWYRSGDDSVKNMGANVKLFLDPENPMDFSVRDELSGKNRQGSDWVVFDIDYRSILGIHKTNEENLITVEYDQNPELYLGKNNGEERTNRNDHLQRIFKGYDEFIYSVFDSNGNEISSDEYTIIKDNDNLKFVTTGSASLSGNTIKFYLNERFKEENLPYTEIKGTQNISYTTFFEGKKIPFVMYDRTGEKLTDVNYRYEGNYIYIDVKDRQFSLYNVTKFVYLLGIDDTHDYEEFKDPDGNSSNKLSTYDAFLYQTTEEINDIKFNFDDEEKKVNIIGNLSYSEFNFNYSTEDMGKFEIHILPYTKNVQYVDLNNFNENIIRTTTIVDDIRIRTDQGNAFISKVKFNDNIDMNYILKKVTITETGREIQFSSYSWDKSGLNISFQEEINNDICSLEFLTISIEISREYLGIDKDRTDRPNSYVGSITGASTFSETNSVYYYIWDPDKLSVYFMEEPDLNNKIKLINFFNIYQFKVFPLNYFTKRLTLDVNVYNYDDEVLPIYAPRIESYEYNSSTGNYEDTSIRGERHPLYWETLNLYKYSDKYEKYVLDKSNCESSKYGYQKTSFTNKNNDYSYTQKHISMNPQFNDVQGNGKYKTNIVTKFLRNNKYEIIPLYNDDNYIESKTIVNDEDNQTITYNVLYPYVNFFGNFKDVQGKGYPNSYIYNQCSKSRYYDYMENRIDYFPMLSYKVTLTNTDPLLSSDLTYEYKCPEIDKKYGYLYYKLVYSSYGSYADIDSDKQYYQFMFKHGPFRGGDYSSYDYYGAGYNPYLESIYPGNYNLSVSLYKMVRGQHGQDNSSMYAKYNEEESENYNYGTIELTKEEEATSDLYNYNIEIPFITVSGKVINEADNSLVYGHGLTIEFINKEDDSKSRKFEYDCSIINSINGPHDWRRKV